MATYQTVLNDLQRRFGDQMLLSPKDIAPIIATSPAVQANLRYQKRFPIPVHEGSGRRVFVNIHDLAQYIATGEVVVEKQPEPEQPAQRASVRTKKGVGDRSWQRALECISQFTYELVKAVEYEELQLALPEKEPVKKSKAERGII